MTGAAVPRGANAVVMQEHAHVEGEYVVFERAAQAGQHFVPAGSGGARRREWCCRAATRLGYAELAMAAEVGRAQLTVTRRPRVAILSTGDEVVAVDADAGTISDSQQQQHFARRAGDAGRRRAGDARQRARTKSQRFAQRSKAGLEADMLVLSGGVSVGKYDLVEQVLRELGAEFFFDAVAMRPGKARGFRLVPRTSRYSGCRGIPFRRW